MGGAQWVVDVEQIPEELHGLNPAEFIAARGASVRLNQPSKMATARPMISKTRSADTSQLDMASLMEGGWDGSLGDGGLLPRPLIMATLLFGCLLSWGMGGDSVRVRAYRPAA